MALPNIGPMELIIVLVIVLLVVGPRRLPEMGQALGRTISEFRRSTSDLGGEESASPAASQVTASPVATEPETRPESTNQ